MRKVFLRVAKVSGVIALAIGGLVLIKKKLFDKKCNKNDRDVDKTNFEENETETLQSETDLVEEKSRVSDTISGRHHEAAILIKEVLNDIDKKEMETTTVLQKEETQSVDFDELDATLDGLLEEE